MSDQAKDQNYGTGGGIIGLIIIGLIAWWGYSHFIKSDNSKPWWTGAQTMSVCPVGENANSYPGADTNNKVGCYTTSVTSDGSKITTLVLRDGSSVFAQGTDCGKVTDRYCDFYDIQNKQWEVKKP